MDGFRLLRQFPDAKTKEEVRAIIARVHGQAKADAAAITSGHNHYPMGSRRPIKRAHGYQAWLPLDKFPSHR